MKKFIEVTVTLREKASIGYITRNYKRVIDLNAISTIYESSEYIIKFYDGGWIPVSSESYEVVRKELLAIGDLQPHDDGLKGQCHENGIKGLTDRLCELQHDHTWVCQAVSNLVIMMKDSDFKPAILKGCHDEELGLLFDVAHERVIGMQKRIKELEREVRIMTEPRKPQ